MDLNNNVVKFHPSHKGSCDADLHFWLHRKSADDMRGREQLLITVDGLPRLTEMKSIKKSLKCGQSVMNMDRTDDGAMSKAAS